MSCVRLLTEFLSLVITSLLYAPWVAVRGRSEWLRHETSTFIAAPPQIVYDLLSPAHPRNRWVSRGEVLETLDAREGGYRLFDPAAPDEAMILVHTLDAPRMVVGLICRPETDAQIGALVGTADRYEITPEAGGCYVTLECDMCFRPGLSLLAYSFHETAMRRAMATDLARLKAEAETRDDERAAEHPDARIAASAGH